jgi:hypothetical protein
MHAKIYCLIYGLHYEKMHNIQLCVLHSDGTCIQDFAFKNVNIPQKNNVDITITILKN